MEDRICNVLNMEISCEHSYVCMCVHLRPIFIVHSLLQPNIHPCQTLGCVK